MALADHPQLQALLVDAVAGLQDALADSLVGVYLSGSLVGGDFDAAASDIDLVAVLTEDIRPQQLPALAAMHLQLVSRWPEWDDRIEVLYVSRRALASFRRQRSPIAVISPGEALHIVEAGDEWLLNWHLVREEGVALYGPPPTELIAPIPDSEVKRRVREDLREWPARLKASPARHRGWQACAILIVCRGVCTLECGRQVSKLVAAAWVKQKYPEQAPLIDRALAWRRSQRQTKQRPHPSTYPQTERLVEFLVTEALNAQ